MLDTVLDVPLGLVHGHGHMGGTTTGLAPHHTITTRDDDDDDVAHGWSVLDLGDFSSCNISVDTRILTPAGECDDDGTGSPVVRRRRPSSAVSEDFDELLRSARRTLAFGESAAATGTTTTTVPSPAPATPIAPVCSSGLYSIAPLEQLHIDDAELDTPEEMPHSVLIPDVAPTLTVTPSMDQRLAAHHPPPSRSPSESPHSMTTYASSTASESPVSPMMSWLAPSPSPARSSPGSPMRKRRSNGASTNPEYAAQRNHVCDLCASRFLCRSKLERHMLTHTGAKPFGCFCGKAFNQKSALKNHTRRHIKKGNLPLDVDVTHGLNGFTYHSLVHKMSM